jgi:hypothetical protein
MRSRSPASGPKTLRVNPNLLHVCNEKKPKTPKFGPFLCQFTVGLVQCTQLLKQRLVLKFNLMKSASFD